MKRLLAILLVVVFIIAALGLMYSSQVIADLTVLYPTSVDVSGAKIVLRPSKAAPSATTSEQSYQLVAQDAGRVVAERLEQLHLRGYYAVDIRDNLVEVTLPDLENTTYIVDIISRVGEVEFIDGGTGTPPVGRYVKTESRNELATRDKSYSVLFKGREIKAIIPPEARDGEIFYQLELQPHAASRFATFLDANSNAYVCLVLDKQVINCSKMYHLADDRLDILPNLSGGTGLSLADLGVFISSGPLPVSLDVVIE
jgi:preprotein translocase subunit SecD